MPIYEYICSDCNNEFEELVFSTNEQINCPDCGTDRVERALSVFSFSSGGSYSSSHGGCNCDGCSSGNCGSCGCGGH